MHASPRARVLWYKDGRELTQNATAPTESESEGAQSASNGLEERMHISHHGRKHLLVVNDVVDTDRGRYTCHAINNLGESKGNIQVMG